jgi:hypothetical protein
MASKSYLFTISYRTFSVVILFNYQPDFHDRDDFFVLSWKYGCTLHTCYSEFRTRTVTSPCIRRTLPEPYLNSNRPCLLVYFKNDLSKPSHVLEPNCIHTVLLQFTNGTTPSTTPVTPLRVYPKKHVWYHFCVRFGSAKLRCFL